MSNADTLRVAVLREFCGRSLANFSKAMWSTLEPGRPLAWGWALDAMCEHLEAVTRGEITRLVINVPPGSMKSLLTSVLWPAWEWSLGKTRNKYLGVAHNTTLSGRDSRKMRLLVRSPLYRELFPHVQLAADQATKLNFATTDHGGRVCMAFRNMTGERGDRVIIDDPMTVEDGFSAAAIEEAARIFNETVPSRVNDDKSAIVMIMQRIHENDPAAIALADPSYERLIIPARYESTRNYNTSRFTDPRTGGPEGALFFPERFSEEATQALERRLGPYGAASQLQQVPAPRSGGFLDPTSIVVSDDLPTMDSCVRGWDMAATEGGGDYTVGALVGRVGDKYYIMDVVRGQWSAANVDKRVVQTAAVDGWQVEQSLPIDPGAAGKAVADRWPSMLPGSPVHTSRESGSKEQRARLLSSVVTDGRLVLSSSIPDDVARSLINEFAAFPAGAHDDIVDAVSRAMNRLSEHSGFNIQGLI